MVKRTFFFIFLSLLLIALSARDGILSYFVERECQKLAKEYLDASFEFEKKYLAQDEENGSTIIFVKPSVSAQDKKNRGEVAWKAETLSFSYRFDFSNFSLKIHVATVQPELKVVKGSREFPFASKIPFLSQQNKASLEDKALIEKINRWPQLLQDYLRKKAPQITFLPVELSAKVDQGTARFLQDNKTLSLTADFLMEGDKIASNMELQSQSEASGEITIKGLRRRSHSVFDVELSSLNLGAIWNFLEFFNLSATGVDLEEGHCDGALSIHLDPSNKSWIEGKLTLSQVSITPTSGQSFSKLEKGTIHFEQSKASSHGQKQEDLIAKLIAGSDISFNLEGIFLDQANVSYEIRNLALNADLKGGEGFIAKGKGDLLPKENSGVQAAILTVESEAAVPAFGEAIGFLRASIEKQVLEDAQVEKASKDKAHFDLHWKQKDTKSSWDISFEKFSGELLRLFQESVQPIMPGISSILFRGGELSVQLLGDIEKGELKKMSVPKLSIHDARFEIPELYFYGQIQNMQGTLSSINQQESFLAALESNVSLTSNEMTWAEPGHLPLVFSQVEASLIVQKGQILKSAISTMLSGLKGEITLDLLSKEKSAKFDFRGKMQNFALLMPEKTKSALLQELADEEVVVVGFAQKRKKGLGVQGDIFIGDTVQNRFGLSGEIGFRNLSQDVEKEILQDVDIAKKALHIKSSLRGLIFNRFVQEKILERGVFVEWAELKVKDVPLKSFASPFIFQGTEMALTGTGSMRARYEAGAIGLYFGGQNVKIESPDIYISVPEVPFDEKEDFHSAYYLDLYSPFQYGQIVANDGVFLEKGVDLYFDQIKTKVLLSSDWVVMPKMQARLKNLALDGYLFVDIKSLDSVGVSTHIDSVVGPVEGVIDTFKRFEDSALLTLNITGDYIGGKGGFALDIMGKSGEKKVDCYLKGRVEKGTAPWFADTVDVQNVGFDITYNSQDDSFSLEQFQATLQSKASDEVYEIKNSNFFFSEGKNDLHFNLVIEKQAFDFIRLTATGKKEKGIDSNLYRIDFENGVTHFGHIYPNFSRFVLEDREGQLQLKELEMRPKVNLASLAFDLEKTAILGFLRVDPRGIDSFKDFSLKGDVYSSLSYSEEKGLLSVESQAGEIEIEGEKFVKLDLVADVQNPFSHEMAILVRKLALGDYNASLEVYQKNEAGLNEEQTASPWLIKNGIFSKGRLASVHFLGKYTPSLKELECTLVDGALSVEEVSLAYPALFKAGEIVRGDIDFSGLLKFNLLKAAPWINWHAAIRVQPTQVSIGELEIQNEEEIALEVVRDRGLFSPSIDLLLSADDLQVREKMGVRLKDLSYSFYQGKWQFSSLDFKVPTSCLPWLFRQGEAEFTGLLNPRIQDFILGLKKDGDLMGSLEVFAVNDASSYKIKLASDHYSLFRKNFFIKDPAVTIEPNEIRVEGGYQLEEVPLWFDSKTHLVNGDLQNGEINLVESKDNLEQAIKVEWVLVDRGVEIESVEGEYAGVHVSITKNRDHIKPNLQTLFGRVKIDFNKFKYIFPMSQRKEIERFGLGIGYELFGSFYLPYDEMKLASFEGTLAAKEFDLLGFILQALSANVKYEENELLIEELKINDVAGELTAPLISIKENADKTDQVIFIPNAEAKEVRPILLRAKDEGTLGMKLLLVDSVVLQDFKGNLSDKTSYTGRGKFIFSRQEKREFVNPLWVIPRGILSAFGLDTRFFIPVMGEIDYSIDDAKVYFTQFKDVYSVERRSEFFLAGGEDAYVDFDGNLHIDFRVKLNNVILKFAEMFVISIRGTLDKPSYTMQRRNNGNQAENPSADSP